MLTIQELNEIRDRVRQHLNIRKFEGDVTLYVSSGTTAIACGSRRLLAAAMDELALLGGEGVQLKQKDLDVQSEEMPAVLISSAEGEVLLKKVTDEQIRRIVRENHRTPIQTEQ